MVEFNAPVEDRRRVTIRLYVLEVTIGAIFAALAIGFWYFQVVENAKFKGWAMVATIFRAVPGGS